MKLPITEENRRWWTLGAMCCALFMAMLDNTVVNVALPSIQRSLDTTLPGLEWTINAYTLTFAVLLVTAGRLGDLFGRVRMFLVGVVIFAVASGLIALAQSDTWLVVGRAVQGAGGAFMMPATLSIISQAFPPEERGKAIGTWAGVSALALAIGPVVGGFLVEHVSWQSIFLLNLPVAVLAIVLTLATARESRDETAVRAIDVPGVTAITVGLGALVLALVQGNHWGWASGRILGLLAVAVASLALFAVVERRSRAPMVDFRFFRSRSFVGATTVGFLVTFSMFAMFFFLTLYLQNVKGYGPMEAGLRFLPATLVLLFMGPFSGRLADKIGSRIPMTLGMTIVSAALFSQSFVDAGSSYLFLVLPFVLMGVGTGLVMSPMTTAAMNAVEHTKAGVASGILNMNRMIGGTFGVAALGALITAMGKDKLTELLPQAGSAQVDRLAEGLGAGATTHGADPAVAAAMQDAFIHALHGGMRVASVIALLGAIAAWATIARRSAAAEAAATAGARTPVESSAATGA